MRAYFPKHATGRDLTLVTVFMSGGCLLPCPYLTHVVRGRVEQQASDFEVVVRQWSEDGCILPFFPQHLLQVGDGKKSRACDLAPEKMITHEASRIWPSTSPYQSFLTTFRPRTKCLKTTGESSRGQLVMLSRIRFMRSTF